MPADGPDKWKSFRKAGPVQGQCHCRTARRISSP
ncbi:hypothetical protein SY94_3146 [Agrobacterium tumefaciens]|nr:hypothetical protein SY94_3146 [Agrobacterium tumefaciens]